MDLKKMTVEQLEQRSYELTAARQSLRAEALAVQAELGRKLEQRKVSQLLGREVTIIDANAIDSDEMLGDVL